jgi:transposase InsO family protein
MIDREHDLPVTKQAEFLLADHGIAISMDGKGAWRDNVFVERLWRSVKYEEVYLRAYETVGEARSSISTFTTAHQNTHLSMLLKRRDFADWDAIPWGILGSVALVRR